MFSFIKSFLPTSYFLPEWLMLDTNPVDSLLQGELLVHLFPMMSTWRPAVSKPHIYVAAYRDAYMLCALQDW